MLRQQVSSHHSTSVLLVLLIQTLGLQMLLDVIVTSKIPRLYVVAHAGV